MDVASLIIRIVLVLCSLFLITVVLLQQGKSAGLSGSIAGGAEVVFGKNKAKSYEAKLENMTKIIAILFMVLSITLVVMARFS
jgi:preprotein translocase subunit SecG